MLRTEASRSAKTCGSKRPRSVSCDETTPPVVPSSSDFLLTKTVPRATVERMSALGATIRYMEGQICVYCTHGDDAYNAYAAWAGDVDPGVQAIFTPPAPSSLPLVTQLMLVHEANIIVLAYRDLRAADFAAMRYPTIDGAGPAFPLPARYHHASFATHDLICRIANPALGVTIHGGFPTIAAQPSGTYICTVQQLWKGKTMHIHVMKG